MFSLVSSRIEFSMRFRIKKKSMWPGMNASSCLFLPSLPASSCILPLSPLCLSVSTLANPPHGLSFHHQKTAFSQSPTKALLLSAPCKPVQCGFRLFQLLTSSEAIPQCCGILSSAGANHQISDLVLMGNVLQEMAFPFREGQASVLGNLH